MKCTKLFAALLAALTLVSLNAAPVLAAQEIEVNEDI